MSQYTIDYLRAEIARKDAILAFYANDENYWTYPVIGGHASAVSTDKGRKALKELEESE